MKSQMYQQVARVGKAIGHGKRLELLELLAQAEQSVDDMARISGTGVTTVSSHLQVLKGAGLVATRREGTKIFYRLAVDEVAGLFVAMKNVAEQVLPLTARDRPDRDDAVVPLAHGLEDTREAFMLDVRPRREFDAGHFPGALSIPLAELDERATDVPVDRRVIVYCRGEFCLLAREAATLLRARGVDAYAMDEGVLEWRAGHDVTLTATA